MDRLENPSLRCIRCGSSFGIDRKKYSCDKCGALLEVDQGEMVFRHDTKFKGVWSYRELIHRGLKPEKIVTRGEGSTKLYRHEKVSEWTGVGNLYMKHEGENPTGSFKDRGMTVAVSEALRLGATETICASTGNTSASAASYSALAGINSSVMIPEGGISLSKLSQAIAYGARIISVPGDFDLAMSQVQDISLSESRYYILNSINPWRIEGQKTIAYEIMEELKSCDFISLPAGNLGNTSAIGKALAELRSMGFIEEIPRIISVQAEGASPFYNLWAGKHNYLQPVKADTIASAIRIGNPVNWEKALRAIRDTDGLVVKVSDSEIISAKRIIDRSGIGCEPASAASVAGVKKLNDEGTIDHSDRVATILTGHILKDAANIAADSSRITLEEFMKESGRALRAF